MSRGLVSQAARLSQGSPSQVAGVDLGRPWPLGIPSMQQAMLVLTGSMDVALGLEPAHQRAMSMFPEWVLDQLRLSRCDDSAPVGRAAANVWRALMAEEGLDLALSVDLQALASLTQEIADAREVLVGACAFAVTAQTPPDELLGAVDAALERFVTRARYERPHSVRRFASTTVRFVADAPPAVKALPFVAAAALVLAGVFHTSALVERGAQEDWVVVGAPDTGHALLVAGKAAPSREALRATIAKLEARGLRVAPGPDGTHVITTRQEP